MGSNRLFLDPFPQRLDQKAILGPVGPTMTRCRPNATLQPCFRPLGPRLHRSTNNKKRQSKINLRGYLGTWGVENVVTEATLGCFDAKLVQTPEDFAQSESVFKLGPNRVVQGVLGKLAFQQAVAPLLAQERQEAKEGATVGEGCRTADTTYTLCSCV